MNIKTLLLCLLMVSGMPGFAGPVQLDSMQVGSRVYHQVSVLGFNATDVYFTHSQGISNVRLKHLDPELQKRFNFDPKAAAAAEEEQAIRNSEFERHVATTAEQTVQVARENARRQELTSPESLADPLSDNSAIGKPLPEFTAERWLGGKPDPSGHFQLIYLWAPWSQASRKFIPEMNTLRVKFIEDVVFISLVSEPAHDPEAEAGVRAEFPTAIDSTAKLTGALGITSVPQAVLVDPKGVVRYLGHPGALNEKRLKELVQKYSEQ